MTGTQWLLLVSLAVTLLLTCLLLIDAITDGRVKGKMLQLAAAYRRFSSTGVLPDRYQRLRLSSFSTKQRLRLSSSSTNQRVLLIRLGLGVLVVLSVIFSGLLLTAGDWAVESTSIQSVTPSGVSSGAAPSSEPRSSSAQGEVIQLARAPSRARTNPRYVPRSSGTCIALFVFSPRSTNVDWTPILGIDTATGLDSGRTNPVVLSRRSI
jgi:hypothetical protein